ncbi:MAG TPA: histidinol phosphate phosphatase domain-containing protein [Syntrophales bacterium]|nr:histidinol phosphate phosphatase domain-containing protein [Syntrophales bacterium]
MIDLHTHSLFSDGELIPSELVSRAVAAGYRALAITDHGDESNVDFILPRLVKVCPKLAAAYRMPVLPGIELTHVPPGDIAALARQARAMGAAVVVVHGETIVEPVPPGTNAAALQADIDILAHPGLLTEEEAAAAAARRIFLEITTRGGHSYTNGHVLKLARAAGAPLLLNTDSHAPGDLMPRDRVMKIARGAGMSGDEIAGMWKNSEALVKRASA